MNAVFYDPADGRIISSVTGNKANIEAHHQPYIEVAEARDDYDATDRVVAGKLEPIV